jgi:hypothetical protein
LKLNRITKFGNLLLGKFLVTIIKLNNAMKPTAF